jgi:DNA-binding IclR family transcriptional regulator
MEIKELGDRLRGMFLEVPGTQLSLSQAARLAGLEPSVCQHVLETLTAAHVLTRREDGTFLLQ